MSDGQPKQKTDAATYHSQSSSTVTHNAIIKLASLDQYTGLRNHRMRFEDAFDINAERVDAANKLDIIFGRGKSLQDYPGNRRMRQITNKYKRIYHSLQRSQKRNLVESVYKEIVGNGARFLTKAPNAIHYLLVDVEVALQKISSLLRCRKQQKRQLLAAQERQSSSDQQLPVANASLSASSPALIKKTRYSIPCKVNDERSLARGCWNSCNPHISREMATLPVPSLHVIPRSNICEIVTTLQHLNQCRRLRLMMDARMKSSIAIGRGVTVTSLQTVHRTAAPKRKEDPDAK